MRLSILTRQLIRVRGKIKIFHLKKLIKPLMFFFWPGWFSRRDGILRTLTVAFYRLFEVRLGWGK